jgi:hypothetical protein
MATSGSWNFSMTAAQVIAAAYEDLGVVMPGGTVTSAQSTMALNRLNQIAKQWQGNSDRSPGLKVWTRQRVTLFLAKGQQSYLVGPATTDARSTTLYGRTTIDAAEASGQTVISVTATSDTTTTPGTTVTATASDLVGIEQDDGTIHWSTVASISAGDTITINDATTAAASVGNYVWWFTSRAQRFPLLEAAVLRDENYNDTGLAVLRDVREYEQGVPDKYADGDPTCILVEPLRIATRVTLDSQPTDVTKTIVMTVLYPAEDYDATTDDIAFPQEWFSALSWELAFRLAPAFGQWTPVMEANRQNAIVLARGVNPEVSDLYFRPNEWE